MGARRCTRVLALGVSVALLLKLLPLVVMFATNAEGFLIACAVASDVVGIIFVLLAAISLLPRGVRDRDPPTARELPWLRWLGGLARCSVAARSRMALSGSNSRSTSASLS